MTKLKVWIESLAASSSGWCVLKSFWIAFRIAAVGWGVSFLVLAYYAATLGGLFRGSHPAEEPRIWVLGILTPAALTLLALVAFHGLLVASLIRRHRQSALVGVLVSGAFSTVGFLFGILVNAMGAFS